MPSKEYPVLNELPGIKAPRSVRVLGRMLAPLIRWWRAAAMARIDKRIAPGLVRLAWNCTNREELEQLLGKPTYVVRAHDSGSENNRKPTDPAIFEIYETTGCRIDLGFKDDKLISISGCARVTAWEAVVSTPSHIRDVKRQRRHSKKLQSFIGSKKEQEILAKELSPETFRCFLQTYFWQPLAPRDESSVGRLYEHVKGSGNYRTLGDLKGILEKTEKLRQAYREYGTCYSATGKFAMLYALVNPEAEQAFQRVFFHPDMLTHLKKYRPLTE